MAQLVVSTSQVNQALPDEPFYSNLDEIPPEQKGESRESDD